MSKKRPGYNWPDHRYEFILLVDSRKGGYRFVGALGRFWSGGQEVDRRQIYRDHFQATPGDAEADPLREVSETVQGQSRRSQRRNRPLALGAFVLLKIVGEEPRLQVVAATRGAWQFSYDGMTRLREGMDSLAESERTLCEKKEVETSWYNNMEVLCWEKQKARRKDGEFGIYRRLFKVSKLGVDGTARIKIRRVDFCQAEDVYVYDIVGLCATDGMLTVDEKSVHAFVWAKIDAGMTEFKRECICDRWKLLDSFLCLLHWDEDGYRPSEEERNGWIEFFPTGVRRAIRANPDVRRAATGSPSGGLCQVDERIGGAQDLGKRENRTPGDGTKDASPHTADGSSRTAADPAQIGPVQRISKNAGDGTKGPVDDVEISRRDGEVAQSAQTPNRETEGTKESGPTISAWRPRNLSPGSWVFLGAFSLIILAGGLWWWGSERLPKGRDAASQGKSLNAGGVSSTCTQIDAKMVAPTGDTLRVIDSLVATGAVGLTEGPLRFSNDVDGIIVGPFFGRTGDEVAKGADLQTSLVMAIKGRAAAETGLTNLHVRQCQWKEVPETDERATEEQCGQILDETGAKAVLWGWVRGPNVHVRFRWTSPPVALDDCGWLVPDDWLPFTMQSQHYGRTVSYSVAGDVRMRPLTDLPIMAISWMAAQRAAQVEDVEQTLFHYRQVLKLVPNNTYVSVMIALNELLLGQDEKAEATLSKAIETNGTYVVLGYVARAGLYHRLGKKRQMQADMRQAESRATGIERFVLVSLYYQCGDHSKALACLDRLAREERSIENPCTGILRACLHNAIGNKAQAIECLKGTGEIEIRGDNRLRAHAFASRAEVWAAVGNRASAISDMTRAIALLPGDADIHLRRAKYFRENGQKDDAIADLLVVAGMKSCAPSKRSDAASELFSFGMLDDAANAYRDYLKIAPAWQDWRIKSAKEAIQLIAENAELRRRAAQPLDGSNRWMRNPPPQAREGDDR